MEDFEAKVKQHGFEGMDDFLTALAALKRGGGSTPAAPGAPTPAADPTKAPAATAGASAEERAQMLRQRNAGHRDRTQTLRRLDEADRIRREKEAEIQRLQAERAQLRMRHEIELAAVRAGAKDADMIVAKVASHVANLDDAGVAAFDLGEYLKAVRKDWPALFGETRIPADTGTGTEAPPAPGSGDAVRGAADTSVNLRQGSRTEYEARLAELGVALPTLGMPDVAR